VRENGDHGSNGEGANFELKTLSGGKSKKVLMFGERTRGTNGVIMGNWNREELGEVFLGESRTVRERKGNVLP